MTSVWIQILPQSKIPNLNSLDALDKKVPPLYHSFEGRNPFPCGSWGAGGLKVGGERAGCVSRPLSTGYVHAPM